MKTLRIVFLFTSLLSLFFMDTKGQANVKMYTASWKKVDDLVKKQLPKSAIAEVKKIYQLAKKEKQDAQVIKSLVYLTGLQSENREDNEVISIKEIETEMAGSGQPVTAILQSLLAEMYWNYYQVHRWELYKRTETTGFKKDDIATWSRDDFHKKIGELYRVSLKEEKLLQQTKLQPFDAIIVRGNVRHLRPTLYDLLAHRALLYFENDERDVAKPSYAFEIDQASAFEPAADFIRNNYATSDSSSLLYQALLIYRGLLRFHINDAKPGALIDADLQRIEFVKRYSVHPDKDQLYFNALNHVTKQYGDLPAAAQAWYLLAIYYNQQADTYTPFGDSTHRFDRLKAKTICERILAQKDSSEGRTNCFNLLNQVQRPHLQFSVEKVNVPQQPFRALIEFRNFTKLFLRVVRVDDLLGKQLEDIYGDKYWSAIIAAKALRTWEQDLPATNDLQQHRAEIKIDALPVGEYLLVAGTEKDFTNKNTLLGARIFYVSNISFVNNENNFFVLDRDNGQPLGNASVQVWEQRYDYKLSKYSKEKTKLYKTDANGFFKREKEPAGSAKRYERNAYQLDITYGSDRLFMNDLINDYYYYRDGSEAEPVTSTAVFLFLDRSLYRPGQTVYFKGIAFNRVTGEKRSRANDNFATTVVLRDANYQDIDSVKVKTNEFGSFSGKFTLPPSGLNGTFSIYTRTGEGAMHFNVEEYKRPKFFVDYEPLRGTYRVNDTIRITGTAKAYAGNNINGALVKYRVVREPRFLYPWLFRRGWFPPSAPMEIAHGEIKTGDDGKFVIAFTAIPDLKLDKKLEPLFDYTVYADVTDVNGETRSGEQRVTVGYKSLILKSTIPATLPNDSLATLSIRTENMNGEFEPSTLMVRIHKLKDQKRLVRERYWERPDQFVMGRDEYVKFFPHDEYDNETDPKNWERESLVFEKLDSSRVNGKFEITAKQWQPGSYLVEITTKDKNGETVKDIQYIELYDAGSHQLAVPRYLWTGPARSIEPGEKTSVGLGTAADNLFVVQQTDREKSALKPVEPTFSFIKLNNEKRSVDFTASESDRGGYGVGWLFVKHNRVYQYNQVIMVPWTNKDLSIEYASYRDKTLPGNEEKWKLKIKGYKNEKLAAELLAGMYDESLDQFYRHEWHKPEIWPLYTYSWSWTSVSNFAALESDQKEIPSLKWSYLIKNYDRLYSVVDGYESRRNYARGVMSMSAPTNKMAPRVDGNDPSKVMSFEVEQSGEVLVQADSAKKEKDGDDSEKPDASRDTRQSPEVRVRKNFNETSFFFPELRTDSVGNIEFSFTMPEALTKWKFQALAHTRDGALGYSSTAIVTQKQLMVQPNAPRFLREGDKMEFSAKIVNLSEKELTGQAEFQLVDATTNQPVDGWFGNMMPQQFFTVAAGQSEAVRFPMSVPFQFNKALVWRIVAKAADFSDGEENMLPVLTNRMLVTETLPLSLKGPGSRQFRFDQLLKAEGSETLQHHALTVEYTSNPAWYAVQALPYLMEYPYDCAEQTWNRYYANSLAAMIANSSPRIKQLFGTWKTIDTAALLSNLQKNQELKAILLEETPWVLQAKSENEQKKNIALLFDMVRMSTELNSSYEKLKQMQSSNGGFVWFKGGPDDRYMTQYIITGIGHLKKLNAVADGQKAKLDEILALAIPYLDRKIKEDHDNLLKNKTDLKKYVPGYSEIQYLYMRSFFPEQPVASTSKKAYEYFRGRATLTWTNQSKYMQGMLVLALGRTGDMKTPQAILRSLKETAIVHDELGMYWKDARRGWFWFEAPIERQALLIEAFKEIGRDDKTADELRTWLLKNKQTNRWESTKATAEACYALLLQGSSPIAVLGNDPAIELSLGNTTLKSTDQKTEAGTGYFKKTIDAKDIKPSMGNITVKVSGPDNSSANQASNATWGAVYWQYFEDLDKITTSATPLSLVKKLFIEKNTDRGPVLRPVNDGDLLKVGDKIKVRIELRVDREMEYVHMKDMRASAMEPVNVLSSYKWQGGLGYYETTKDASTNFFFNHLRKGTYVFEYPLFISHAGNFSNGITSIQCMYAPEFSAHSEGVRITVE